MKSYLLQEADAVSRQAKLDTAKRLNLRVHSLQHDGILGGMHDTLSPTEVANVMSQDASHAAGYKVEVTVK